MICSLLLTGLLASGFPLADGPPASTDDLKTYQRAASEARRDPEAHVKLALWCEAHNLSAERVRHLTLATLLDPSNAAARGLLGLVFSDGKWRRADAVGSGPGVDPARQAVQQEYLQRRLKARDTADAQWELALWCEQKRLDAQATAHLYRVVKLDPRRDAAWKRLGYKKSGGQWARPELLTAARAELEAQTRANKFWKPKLDHLRDGLNGRDRGKRAAALQALGHITDPRAVPMVWSAFARGSEADQRVAVQVLGQIDAPGASRALSLIGLFSPSAEVRGSAAAILRRRDPREYAGLLVGMIRDRVRYRASRVGGPGSPGSLTIEGRTGDTEYRYSPPPTPTYVPSFNDTVFTDEKGLPVVFHPLGHYTMLDASQLASSFAAQNATADRLQSSLNQTMPGPGGQQLGSAVADNLRAVTASNATIFRNLQQNTGPVPGAPHGFETVQMGLAYAQIPIGEMMIAAQTTAWLAQKQLEADVRSVRDLNAQIDQSNSRALQILRDVSGRDLGSDRASWDKWLTDLNGYAYVSPSSPSDKPTVVQEVPLTQVPQPAVTLNAMEGPIVNVPRHSCFAAGTLVHTWDGPRPIEDLIAGDLVLTRDTATGSLDFRPVVVAFHNPPNETFRIDLGKDEIVATGIHRFWKAGQGWVMARDLRPGDRLRTVNGAAEVKAVRADGVQKVYNLQVAGADNFFVGGSGILAHDNSLVAPAEKPFDRVPSVQDLVIK